MDERIVLRTMNQSEMSSIFLIDPFLPRHLGSVFGKLVVGWSEREIEGPGFSSVRLWRGLTEISSLWDLPSMLDYPTPP